MIKRESWAGKYRIVARDNKGRLISHKKWSQKTPVSDFRQQFKQTGTLRPDVFRVKLTNVVETTDYRKKPVITQTRFQVVVSGYIRKTHIVRRSDTEPKGTSIAQMKEQALERFYAEVAKELGLGYDADEGMRNAQKVTDFKFGVVTYARA